MVRDRLTGAVRAGLGGGRRIGGVERLRGGSKKGVYRLAFDDGSTVVAYLWDAAEDYWPDRGEARDDSDPFAHASGVDLFLAAHRHLDALGIRVPRLHWADAEIALVEDVRGGTLEALLDRDPERARPAMRRLAEILETMRRQRGPGFGKVAFPPGRAGGSCEEVVLGRALGDLAEAASRDARMAAAHDRVRDVVHDLAAAVPPRSRHGLVHGELGPDHVLVDELGDPVLIDVEGLMFFDVEWEHAFLRIRFGEHYRHLRAAGLDERRLAFYTLAMRLSLVAGPLRLLDGDFPDRAFMRGIAEHNLREALASLPAHGPA